MENLKAKYLESPLGLIEVLASENGIVSIHLGGERNKEDSDIKILIDASNQLQEYFEGKRKSFNLKYDLTGTDFQKRVWSELEKIPYNKTISYLELSRRLGDEKSIRAAASANGKNPVAIAIPCHRVIGSNGELIGYAGGLWRKQWLLEHESGVRSLKLEI
ncbi:MAG: methylated-DNA--[protein]-cysteine S-methyltransferase [Bacteroidia bacterium]